MPRSAAVDEFVLEYADHGPRGGSAVVLLHGWPGSARDYRDAASQYSAAAQARSIAGLIEELGLDRPVVAGYDVGSRVAQRLPADRPELVGALAISPPLPGVGQRVLEPERVTQY